jgi:hypothetical protein
VGSVTGLKENHKDYVRRGFRGGLVTGSSSFGSWAFGETFDRNSFFGHGVNAFAAIADGDEDRAEDHEDGNGGGDNHDGDRANGNRQNGGRRND